MKEKIQEWKRLWKDGGIRRWGILFLVGTLLVTIAMPMERMTTGTDRAENAVNGSGTVSNAKQENDRASGQTSGTISTSGGEHKSAASSVTAYEQELEARLTALIGQIQGAGKVQVMVTVSRSSQQILQQNVSQESSIVRETDPQGGNRDNQQLRQENQTVLTGGSGTSQPYVIGEIMPVVEGVVVACEGGDRPSIQAEISAAIEALFDLAPHKIKVCKMASP